MAAKVNIAVHGVPSIVQNNNLPRRAPIFAGRCAVDVAHEGQTAKGW
jgi:hypothetical protein